MVVKENERLVTEVERLTDQWADAFVDAVYEATNSDESEAEVL